jgi:hypothetical protein
MTAVVENRIENAVAETRGPMLASTFNEWQQELK